MKKEGSGFLRTSEPGNCLLNKMDEAISDRNTIDENTYLTNIKVFAITRDQSSKIPDQVTCCFMQSPFAPRRVAARFIGPPLA
jgi:hypothetical protein